MDGVRHLTLILALWLLSATAAQATAIYRFSFDNQQGNTPGTVSGRVALDFLPSARDSGSGRMSFDVSSLVAPVNGSDAAALWALLTEVLNKVVVEKGVVIEYQFGAGSLADPNGPMFCMNNGPAFQFPAGAQFTCEGGMHWLGTRDRQVFNIGNVNAVTFSPVAEPGTIALCCAGLLPMAALRRRRQRECSAKIG